jgi:hypothetical protein
MAALDFPASPTNGQQYSGPGGVIWVYDLPGTKWVAATLAGGVYAPLVAPVFQGDARAVTPATGDADTSIATTAFVRNGTTTNDNAAAGQVGEYITANLASGSPITMTTSGTSYNITSISLTAGDWDVSGNASINANNATGATAIIAWVSSTSAAAPASGTDGIASVSTATSSVLGAATLATGDRRFSLAAPATIYLSGLWFGAAQTVTAYGTIRARRAR